jgi:hypothetical protein
MRRNTTITDADLEEVKRLMEKHGGNRLVVCEELKISGRSLRERLQRISFLWPDWEMPRPKQPTRVSQLTADELEETVEAIVTQGSKAGAARSLGMSIGALNHRISQATLRSDWTPGGRADAPEPEVKELPSASGNGKRYILTCAQSGTKLHELTWDALKEVAKFYNAEIMISTFSYVHRLEGSAKRGTETESERDWYDPRIEEFVQDKPILLAPDLIWHGNMNITPTAVDPLSGFDAYGGQKSGVFPHVKVALRSIATVGAVPAKLQYTTGTVTQSNYIQRKAGLKAEFDHVYGGLLVEVDHNGDWWARHLIVDKYGCVYDGDMKWLPEQNGWPLVTDCAAIILGDVHVAQLQHEREEQIWGQDGLIETMRPKAQILHDLLDFESRSHHARKDPHEMFRLHKTKRECVQTELHNVRRLLERACGWSHVYVIHSNHDRHLHRWLKEVDWRNDPVNARFYLDIQSAWIKAIEEGQEFDPFEWAVSPWHDPVFKATFMKPGQSLEMHDVELSLHGDLGPNGARGSAASLAKLGRKTVVGHSHRAGIYGGCYQVGVAATLDMAYNRSAPSAWSHTDCILHNNGKRQLVTWRAGKWRL